MKILKLLFLTICFYSPITTIFADKNDLSHIYSLALKGNADAQYALGEKYFWGQGVNKDYIKAIVWYKQAAAQGHRNAQDIINKLNESTQQVTTTNKNTINIYSKAAAQGDAIAQFELGYIFVNNQDYINAFKWLNKSASQGYSKAQSMLGDMYRDGRGVKQDYNKAINLFNKAAAQGDSHTQFKLGEMLATDADIPSKKNEQAIYWYRKAAAQGHERAQYNLEWIYETNRGNKEEAIKYYQKLALQGDAYGEYSLGWMYEKGYGVAQNFSQALTWYNKAAAKGNTFSEDKIGDMYMRGDGVVKDYNKAIYWYRKAVAKDYTYSKPKLKLLETN